MSTINRLHLDFSLETTNERTEFIHNYIKSQTFKDKPLTNEELNVISNYILWGKDPKTGLNAIQTKEIEIETTKKTWAKEKPESLDTIIENSAFDDLLFKRYDEVRPKIPRVIFDREKTLEECPKEMRQTFLELFNQIDKLDLAINFYELKHGKRKNAPRNKLIKKFSEKEQLEIKQEIEHWNQHIYLKKRHLLVELRRQQFNLKDMYSNYVERHTINYEAQHLNNQRIDFDSEVKIFPLGIKRNDKASKLIFREYYQLIPGNYSNEELKDISKLIWVKQEQQKDKKANLYIDFRELEHVYWLFNMLFELEDYGTRPDIFVSTLELLDTLYYYMREADLSDIHKDILEMKIQKRRNQDIAYDINHKYGKSYTANYISTIFRHKIIPRINDAAIYHEKILQNLFFEEEFKQCSKCKKTMLKDNRYFGKKSRSKDGFSGKCKKCDKEERNNKK